MEWSEADYHFNLLVPLEQEHTSVGWTFVCFKYACDLNSQDGAHPGLSMFNDVWTEVSCLDKILTISSFSSFSSGHIIGFFSSLIN